MFEDVISALAKVLGDISQGHKGWGSAEVSKCKGQFAARAKKGCPEMTCFLEGIREGISQKVMWGENGV